MRKRYYSRDDYKAVQEGRRRVPDEVRAAMEKAESEIDSPVMSGGQEIGRKVYYHIYKARGVWYVTFAFDHIPPALPRGMLSRPTLS